MPGNCFIDAIYIGHLNFTVSSKYLCLFTRILAHLHLYAEYGEHRDRNNFTKIYKKCTEYRNIKYSEMLDF